MLRMGKCRHHPAAQHDGFRRTTWHLCARQKSTTCRTPWVLGSSVTTLHSTQHSLGSLVTASAPPPPRAGATVCLCDLTEHAWCCTPQSQAECMTTHCTAVGTLVVLHRQRAGSLVTTNPPHTHTGATVCVCSPTVQVWQLPMHCT